MSSKKVLIVAGGTGGHVFPALSIAKELQEKGISVHWVGTQRGIESKVIPAESIPIHFIAAFGFQGKNFLRKLRSLFYLLIGVIQSLIVIIRYKPDAVLAMGGFVSVPVGFAAWLLRKPLVLHEQNSVLGLANRILSGLASKILTGFPRIVGCRRPYQYVGNPVRKAIAAVPPPSERFKSRTGAPLRVLVFGGSQGAAVFNRSFPAWFDALSKNLSFEIWHQTGARFLETVRERYDVLKLSARVDAFIEDMAGAYAWADLVISRSGASTVAELSAVGVPAILVPYPHSDKQQTSNAEFLSKEGAAFVLPESDMNFEKFQAAFNTLISPQRRDFLRGAEERTAGAYMGYVRTVSDDGSFVANSFTKGITHKRKNLLQMACKARALKKEDAATRIVKALEILISRTLLENG